MTAILTRSRGLATTVLVGAGCAISAAGILHISIASQLYRWFAAFVPHGLSVVGPPFLLNHFIVGVLLLATGLTTCIGAIDVRSGSKASWHIILINTIAVCFLPLLLVTLMRGPYYRAPVFIIAEILVWLSALAMVAAVALTKPRGTPS